MSAGLLGHSELGTASRRVTFCYGSHFKGPNPQAVHSTMLLALGSLYHVVARTLSTHPGMVLTLGRRRADAAGYVHRRVKSTSLRLVSPWEWPRHVSLFPMAETEWKE